MARGTKIRPSRAPAPTSKCLFIEMPVEIMELIFGNMNAVDLLAILQVSRSIRVRRRVADVR